jgi:hypothetical protein
MTKNALIILDKNNLEYKKLLVVYKIKLEGTLLKIESILKEIEKP